ncbi:hypothetical protein EVB81_091 [Rhizobium phage RHph_I46]|uniref:Uncharacterized protein n=1 Tax=Rhizobium phage RHph_I1_9 TaxID=2509729 RepID=A0A7S5R9E4_9CAUD|nr:hypothetical protein PP936_gp090 [Rhizobium phage RHph_I1_9]QIG69660.1 hypothetical protein EVB81_091 [Rhizobium phage RHph_I46]QIG70941.1 hypothetical protein EVB92_091 [Rhizobium phage RHph_I9]QIG73527.1 hypothetical protein EVC04_090 [Rhizobium phage RHph_I1_9]QIG76280.1 hypothetical protein EVC25_091 [Rhizobium phage RHph_I34]
MTQIQEFPPLRNVRMMKCLDGSLFMYNTMAFAIFEPREGVYVLSACYETGDLYISELFSYAIAEEITPDAFSLNSFKIPLTKFFLYKDWLESLGFEITIEINFKE